MLFLKRLLGLGKRGFVAFRLSRDHSVSDSFSIMMV